MRRACVTGTAAPVPCDRAHRATPYGRGTGAGRVGGRPAPTCRLPGHPTRAFCTNATSAHSSIVHRRCTSAMRLCTARAAPRARPTRPHGAGEQCCGRGACVRDCTARRGRCAAPCCTVPPSARHPPTQAARRAARASRPVARRRADVHAPLQRPREGERAQPACGSARESIARSVQRARGSTVRWASPHRKNGSISPARKVLRAGPCGPDPSVGWVGPCAQERTPDAGRLDRRLSFSCRSLPLCTIAHRSAPGEVAPPVEVPPKATASARGRRLMDVDRRC